MNRENDIIEMTFNVTWFCPNQCSYCYRSRITDQKNITVLSETKLREECERAKSLGINSFRISGGEPICIGEKLFEYADIIYSITDEKPILMTSGYQINDSWLKKAANKFSSIAVSIDNPLESSKSNDLLDMISSYTSDELPLVYGLTLVNSESITDVHKIFDYMYSKVNHRFMPQIDYACLGNYHSPTSDQLITIKKITKELFSFYGIIPYYFVYLIGSFLWLEKSQQRIVLNLHPEGNYQIHKHCEERLEVEYAWRDYLIQQQTESLICQKCEWSDCCKHHPLWDMRYDWCNLRQAIFEGAFEGLS